MEIDPVSRGIFADLRVPRLEVVEVAPVLAAPSVDLLSQHDAGPCGLLAVPSLCPNCHELGEPSNPRIQGGGSGTRTAPNARSSRLVLTQLSRSVLGVPVQMSRPVVCWHVGHVAQAFGLQRPNPRARYQDTFR